MMMMMIIVPDHFVSKFLKHPVCLDSVDTESVTLGDCQFLTYAIIRPIYIYIYIYICKLF